MLSLFSCAALLCLPLPQQPQGPATPDYGRDIRPLLADRCFQCHGPDAGSREAELRLDTREGATRDLGGHAAIVPGNAEASELWRRITSPDTDQVMPPAKAHKQAFTDHELVMLRRWIEAGARWSQHWAFVAPAKVALPAAAAHPVDALIEASLARRGWQLADEAPRHTLLRRLSFDLTGLPPDPDQLAQHDDEASHDAYIEELLASPQHAERLAMWWLDAARYADTDGFQADAVRDNWPWRDWVVSAFAQNMRFDRFTELQFAGDLLPDAGPDQILATCFHRNHMHNGEGGRDPEESRVDYVRDRVNTTGAVWMGLTMECAQCHDHKFDPISQDDYYAMSAFFDSIDETGRAGRQAKPFLAYRSPHGDAALAIAKDDQKLANDHLEQLRTDSLAGFEQWLLSNYERVGASYRGWLPLTPTAAECEPVTAQLQTTASGTVRRSGANTLQDEFVVQLDAGRLTQLTGIELEVLPLADARAGFGPTGDFIMTGIRLQVVRSGGRIEAPLSKAAASVEGKGVIAMFGAITGALDDDPRTGWRVGKKDLQGDGKRARARFALAETMQLQAGDRLEVRLLFRSQVPSAYPEQLLLRATGERGPAAHELRTSPLEALSALVAEQVAVRELPKELRTRLHEQFLLEDPRWSRALHRKRRLDAQVKAAQRATKDLQVTVLAERKQPRTTHILERGEWDQHGAVVTRHFPTAVFRHAASLGKPTLSRLDLAHWLTDASNPLTSRVIVNQVWQMLFGRGLVATPDDFGLQGQTPIYPELLDWLAVDFVESGWDLRHLIRTIVTSRTYRQDSTIAPDRLASDPDNRLLARGPRYRLPSWMIRDAALAAAGLLDRSLGGPPVFPHQPEGVWADLFMGRFRYHPTIGRARHRRTLYAFWRRNAAPTFLFDHADRRGCSVNAQRTNTPLQSLTLLNDRTFAECARALAERAIGDADAPPATNIQRMAKRVLQRLLSEPELQHLLALHQRTVERLDHDRSAVEAMTSASPLDAAPRPTPDNARAVAALAAIAGVLLNLDEAITHE